MAMLGDSSDGTMPEFTNEDMDLVGIPKETVEKAPVEGKVESRC